MNTHTLGPWHEAFVSEKTWHKGIYDSAGQEVALVKVKSALTAHRRDADARLIAAAPDLLEALMLMIFDEHGKEWRDSKVDQGVWDDRRELGEDKAHAAIAKATGAAS